MFEKGNCFDFNGVIIEVTEINRETEMYKVKYFIEKGNEYEKKEGFISENLLKYIPTFPF